MLDHSTNHEEQGGSSDHGLGPPDPLCQMDEDQCIEPSVLQLAPRQPCEERQPSPLDVATDGNSAFEASHLPLSSFSPTQDSFSDSPDVQGPMGIPDDLSGVEVAPALMETGFDEAFFESPGTGEVESLDDVCSEIPGFSGRMNIDACFPCTEEAPEPMDTNEQFFDHPEVRQLVDIHDDLSDTLEDPEPMDIEVEEREQVPGCGLPSPAPSPPTSLPPPSPAPRHPEAENDVYIVERILQAWGPKRRRQYLIRWEGWGAEFDTWEPACNVSEELRAEFEGECRRRRHGRRTE